MTQANQRANTSGYGISLVAGVPTENPDLADKIYSQSPAPGTSLTSGSSISVTTYNLVSFKTVPNVLGLTTTNATSLITAANLQAEVVGDVEYVDSSIGLDFSFKVKSISSTAQLNGQSYPNQNMYFFVESTKYNEADTPLSDDDYTLFPPFSVKIGNTYKVDQSDSSNTGRAMFFSTTTSESNVLTPFQGIRYYINNQQVPDYAAYKAAFNTATSRYVVITPSSSVSTFSLRRSTNFISPLPLP